MSSLVAHLGRIFALALLGVSLAQATDLQDIPGSDVHYFVGAAGSAQNSGGVVLLEPGDGKDRAYLLINCHLPGERGIWSALSTVQTLVTPKDVSARRLPAVTLRLGGDAAFTVAGTELEASRNGSGELETGDLGFRPATTARLISGLLAGKNLMVQVRTAGQARPSLYTYTFRTAGFGAAWKAVKACK